jgi:hypothetical protein
VGGAAYAAVCVTLASAAWVAVGSVAARGVETTPSAIAAAATATATLEASASATPDPTPTPWQLDSLPSFGTPAPTPAPFSMDIYKKGTFVSQITKYACMAGAVQNMLNIIGPKVDLSSARQVQISQAIVANTTKEDSHNGGYGPAGWALTMTQMGAGRYKLVIDNSVDDALRDAATALRATRRPVGLLSWWGAHSWVMTGFQSTQDPRYYPGGFAVLGAYIVDPYYPRHSSIWGQTLGPDTFRDMPAMRHNYIGWKRPEGHYPGRDGKWLLVVPY